MTVPGIRRLSKAWAAFDRYRRLNFAVLSCLAVMFGLVMSLVFAVRLLDDYTQTRLQESYGHDAVSRDLLLVASTLERVDTDSGDAVQELSLLRDRIGPVVETLDEEFAVEQVELFYLLDQVAIVIDTEGAVIAATPVEEMANRLEGLSETFRSEAEQEVVRAEVRLDSWFRWMQIVALTASVIFFLVVMWAILPLSRSIERSLNRLQSWQARATRETARRTLTVQVNDGLDVADTESAAFAVLGRALQTAAPDHAVEILLADSSQAHLRASVEHPDNGGAGCGVTSPWSCPAVRRGSTMVFEDSHGIRSCPHLAARETPCSAVCSPLTFMGQPMGVLHAVGPVDEAPPKELVEDLTVVAAEAATRLGTLRAFAKAELQASTDVLTGLPNRRSTEERVRQIVGDGRGGAIAVIEVEGLVDLNGRLGKAAGDRAVTAVADALQLASRPDDVIGRWSGSEFVAVFAEHDAGEASTVARRMASEAEAALARADLSGVSVLSGVADTRLADSVRELFEVANSSLAFARRATLRRRSASAAPSN